MNMNETLAIVSLGGFAVQRALEVLDFAIVSVAFGIKKALDGNSKTAGLGVTEVDTKKWVMALAGFGIGLLIASFSNISLDDSLGKLNVIVGALAISGGSEGFNSVMKFANHVKEARKVEVRPLPEIKVTPVATTIKAGTSIQILANVAGTDVKTVSWELLEQGQGGGVVPKSAAEPNTGIFTAPTSAGTFHVAAISTDNPAANAIATITVAA